MLCEFRPLGFFRNLGSLKINLDVYCLEPVQLDSCTCLRNADNKIVTDHALSARRVAVLGLRFTEDAASGKEQILVQMADTCQGAGVNALHGVRIPKPHA